MTHDEISKRMNGRNIVEVEATDTLLVFKLDDGQCLAFVAHSIGPGKVWIASENWTAPKESA